MLKFIEEATKEFNQNGRSKAFIAMEDKIIKGGKPVQMYFFARFAKGASVERLQSAIVEYGNMEQFYYFQQFVKGADILPFIKKALEQGDAFWTKKFISLSKSQGVYENIRDLVVNYKDDLRPMTRTRGTALDINYTIATACDEYKKHGRSDYYKELEKEVLYSESKADAKLFLYHVPGGDVKKFERGAFMRCDPFEMFFLATHIEGVNADLMYKGLELAKQNYLESEKSYADIEKRKVEALKKLKYYKKHKNAEGYATWLEIYQALPAIPEYIAQIENRYMPPVKTVLRSQGKLV